ncbi:hypothetical protein IFM89_031747 [Coptis chinensis]|uniref:Sugar phosphate transporter domain-containing protein n=1 Tax=Coptis chinensis TaxID=261450 RepID=A0A835H3R8_9MAGN|nr:hypothetical protein IFM89_031747 [Coptis chinensis]
MMHNVVLSASNDDLNDEPLFPPVTVSVGNQHPRESGTSYSRSWQCIETCVCDRFLLLGSPVSVLLDPQIFVNFHKRGAEQANPKLCTGNKISTQTGIGTAIAIAGVAIYSYLKAKIEEEKRTDINSTNLYAYISIIALIVCIPPAIILEGPQLMKHGISMIKFISDLFWVGMFYHLYSQLATNTLERVAPLTHTVGNVLKRVFVASQLLSLKRGAEQANKKLRTGNKISPQSGIGTAIAIAGVAIYSYLMAKIEEEKRGVMHTDDSLVKRKFHVAPRKKKLPESKRAMDSEGTFGIDIFPKIHIDGGRDMPQSVPTRLSFPLRP